MGKKGRTAEVVVYLQKGSALHPLVLAPCPHIPLSLRHRPVLASPSPPEGVGMWHGDRRGVDVEVAWRGGGRGHRRGGVVKVEVEVAWQQLSLSLSRAGRRGR